MSIEIVAYRETWNDEFAALAQNLDGALGDLALRIDHIGSTAVRDLAAKDVIDIQITVAKLDDSRVIEAMESLGYSEHPTINCDHRPPGASGSDHDWEKRFFNPPKGQRRTNTHMRVQGRPNQRYPILFRDFLRANSDYATAYAELKRRLAANLADSETYPIVKDPAVDLIYFAAESWAENSGWQLQET